VFTDENPGDDRQAMAAREFAGRRGDLNRDRVHRGHVLNRVYEEHLLWQVCWSRTEVGKRSPEPSEGEPGKVGKMMLQNNRENPEVEQDDTVEELLDAAPVAKILGVSLQWIKDHTTRIEPIIPHIRLGRKIRFRRADIERFIQMQAETRPSWARTA
jgi:hypothetical protein